MPPIPERIGRYDIVDLVGKGGMGVLYRAHDPSLERDVALKMMHLDFTLDTTARERFQREAKAVARLQHQNIVTIHELGEIDNAPYIVMELLGGRDLDQILRSDEGLTLAQKLDVVAQLCDGLAFAHDQGIVHRDIKPGNIRLLEDGTVKILDFGIAKFAQSSLTQSGTVMGTPSYMAPEQISGQPVDGRADVFSAGVLLYELLSGHRPFVGDSPTAVAYQIMHTDPHPLRDELPDLPDAVNQIVSRALQKSADERYAKARDMASDLHTVKIMLDMPMRDGATGALAPEDVTQELHATAITRSKPLSDAKLHADPIETVSTPTVAAPAAKGGLKPIWLISGLAVVVAAAAGYYALTGGGDAGEAEPGTDSGAVAPADPAADPSAPGTGAAPVAADTIDVTSTPEGAAITLNGVDTGQVTPATVSLGGTVPGEIVLALDGYDPLTASITQDDLEAGSKDLTLLAVERPVQLTVSGSYPFEVVRGSQVLSASAMRHEIRVEPGGAAVRARSTDYLLDARLSVNYRRSSGSITLPEPGTLAIFGTPVYDPCTVLVDGQDLGPPPIPNKPIAAGRHAVVMRCPDGREETQNATVESGGRQQVNFQGVMR
jgi:serine/threonine-protein kinase